MKCIIIALSLIAAALSAGAAGFTKDGQAGSVSFGYNYLTDREHLVLDGSFEAGCGAYWTCASANTCLWIADLVPVGLWNYDGSYVYWAGGFCAGLATCSSSVCQSMLLGAGSLGWNWMAYVNDSVGVNYVEFDGTIVYRRVLQPGDHLLDYQQECVRLDIDWGLHELCFGVDNEADCGANLGDNWFVDYVEFLGETAAEAMSFSVVKALY